MELGLRCPDCKAFVSETLKDAVDELELVCPVCGCEEISSRCFTGIDPLLVGHLEKLKERGFETVFSCQGHIGSFFPYIYIRGNIEDDLRLKILKEAADETNVHFTFLNNEVTYYFITEVSENKFVIRYVVKDVPDIPMFDIPMFRDGISNKHLFEQISILTFDKALKELISNYDKLRDYDNFVSRR